MTGLRPPARRVGAAARRWWAAQALVLVSGPMLLTAAALVVLSFLFFPGALPWLAPLVAVVLVVPALFYVLAMPALRFRTHGWEVGHSAVYAASGWLWRRRRVVPLSRVEGVTLARGPLQRWFGLATVTVTAGSTAAGVRIAGVPEAEARGLVERVRAVMGEGVPA